MSTKQYQRPSCLRDPAVQAWEKEEPSPPTQPPQQQSKSSHVAKRLAVAVNGEESTAPASDENNREKSKKREIAKKPAAKRVRKKATVPSRSASDQPRRTAEQEEFLRELTNLESLPVTIQYALKNPAQWEGWMQLVDLSGRVYYGNTVRGASQWSPPDNWLEFTLPLGAKWNALLSPSSLLSVAAIMEQSSRTAHQHEAARASTANASASAGADASRTLKPAAAAGPEEVSDRQNRKSPSNSGIRPEISCNEQPSASGSDQSGSNDAAAAQTSKNTNENAGTAVAANLTSNSDAENEAAASLDDDDGGVDLAVVDDNDERHEQFDPYEKLPTRKRKTGKRKSPPKPDDDDDEGDEDYDPNEKPARRKKYTYKRKSPPPKKKTGKRKSPPKPDTSNTEETSSPPKQMTKSMTERSEQWFQQTLTELKAYKDQHGNLKLPCTNTTAFRNAPEHIRKLRYRLEALRHNYLQLKRGQPSNLTLERILRLNEVGIDFVQKRKPHPTWEERMEQCRAFVAEHGHLRIPSNHLLLGRWCSSIRIQYKHKLEGKKNALSDERQKQLEEMGFVFLAGKRMAEGFLRKKKSWDQRLEEFIEFKRVHGHPFVPQHLPGGLGQWVATQRQAYRHMQEGRQNPRHHMTAEKALKMSNAGFCWDASSIRRTPQSALVLNEDDVMEDDEQQEEEGILQLYR